MARMPYSFAGSLSQWSRSDVCVHVRLSFSIASSQFSRFLSSDTEKISSPFSLYFSYAATFPGLERRQGPHHEAQKSSNTYLPGENCSENCTGLPSVLFTVKSGAGLPIDTTSRVAATSLRTST